MVRQIIICGNDVLPDWTEHSSSHYDMKNDSTLWSGNGDIFELKELKTTAESRGTGSGLSGYLRHYAFGGYAAEVFEPVRESLYGFDCPGGNKDASGAMAGGRACIGCFCVSTINIP